MIGRRLPGSEKYQRPPEQRKRSNSAIDRANELPIQVVLADEFDVHVPIEITTSWKTYCPFSWEHMDGGTDKTLRVYPTNSAFCFALHGVLTPVKLISVQRDVEPIQAARWLCDRYGLVGPREPYWERMSKLILERETRTSVGGNPAHAVLALQQALQGVPAYEATQYDPVVIAEVERWLEALDDLTGVHREGAVRDWFRDALASIAQVASDTQTSYDG